MSAHRPGDYRYLVRESGVSLVRVINSGDDNSLIEGASPDGLTKPGAKRDVPNASLYADFTAAKIGRAHV